MQNRKSQFVACWLLQSALFSAALAQDRPRPRYEVEVSCASPWTDTGIDMFSGTRLSFTATGTLEFAQGRLSGPDGIPRGWKDLLRVLPVNSTGRGALLGRVGSGDYSIPFVIGSQKEFRSVSTGRLSLAINQEVVPSCEGSFQVSIQVLEPGSATAPDLAVLAADPEKDRIAVPGVNQRLFAKIPRRVTDDLGNPGDMVNFLMLGSEEQVRRAFSQAGWVIVDKDKKAAIVHALILTLTKQAYVELPMSELYLFGRSQDYGFAHAEPFAVVQTRHHLRVWRAPFDVNGQALWVGAATHDIGIERDQRDNRMTHRIDPDVDTERRFVAQSLAETGVITTVSYLLPQNPLREARTATGGIFHSDGNVLILVCGGPEQAP